jgi:hypothetical protein
MNDLGFFNNNVDVDKESDTVNEDLVWWRTDKVPKFKIKLFPFNGNNAKKKCLSPSAKKCDPYWTKKNAFDISRTLGLKKSHAHSFFRYLT